MKKEKANLSRLWTGSIVAALVAAVAIFVGMLQVEKNVLANFEKKMIYVATERIPKGQLLTSENYMDYLVQKEVDASCIPPTALQTAEQIKDMVPTADIDKGVLLTTGMFVEINNITKEMQEPVIAGVKAEDLYQVAGGTLRAGDKIHIYVVAESGDTTLVWEKVYIQEVFDGSGAVITNEDKLSSAQRLNVYIDKADVQRFYRELAQGSLRVVKVCD